MTLDKARIDKSWLNARAEDIRKVDYIDPALYRKYNVKRGLRNEDGTGVRVGLSTIGNVHGYVVSEGEKQAIPGELFNRGIDVKDIVKADKREHRYGYEETAYLLLFGELPTMKQLIQWKNMLGSYRRLSDGFKENAIMRNPSKDLMNSMARAVLFIGVGTDPADFVGCCCAATHDISVWRDSVLSGIMIR